MSWTTGTWYAFDTETTGIDVHTDRIVTATIIKITASTPGDHRSWLIDPGIEIPEGATKVHGITTDHARANGVHPTEALSAIANTLTGVLRARLPLVAMNAAYDLSILEAELRRHNEPTLTNTLNPDDWHTLVDPMVLARGLDTVNRAFRKGRTYKLPDLCKRYGVPFTESHDAHADAIGAGLVAAAIVDSDLDLASRGPAELFRMQSTWRREDQRRFRDWVEKAGKEDQYGDIDGGWPLHTRLTEAVAA
jgi:DNA polymerase III subunit epsilon